MERILKTANRYSVQTVVRKALADAIALDRATPEVNPVWIKVKEGKIVRTGLTGIDDPNDLETGIIGG